MKINFEPLSKREILGVVLAAAITVPFSATWAQDDSVDEIIVTVERREQSLQDYAGTAAQISGDDLKKLGIANMTDLDGAIPGLNITNNSGNIEVWIRGVGSSNNTELGDPAAATHMNGVYIPRPAGFGSAFFDIQRVEVNFGPQGTIRGRNAMAGSVDAVAFKPGLGITDGMVEVGIGSHSEQSAQGVVNLAVTDNSAARFAFYTQSNDSLYTNLSPDPDSISIVQSVKNGNLRDTGRLDNRNKYELGEARDSEAVRLSYYIEPSDNLDVTLVFDNIEANDTGYTGTNYTNPIYNLANPFDLDGRRVLSSYGRQPSDAVEHWGIKLELNYSTDFGDLQWISSHRDMENNRQATNPLTPVFDGVSVASNDYMLTETYDNFSFYDLSSTSESKVNELRFSSNEVSSFGLPLNWTAGLFHFEEDQRTFLGTVSDRVEFYNEGPTPSYSEFNNWTESESTAVYFDGTYDLANDKRVSAGYRYTDESKQRFGIAAEVGWHFGNINFDRLADPATAGDAPYTNWGAGGRIGSAGFELAKFDRSIYIPDADNSGTIDQAEWHAFFFDGVKSWGEDDTINHTFAAGPLAGAWGTNPSQAVQDAVDAGFKVGLCVVTTAERADTADNLTTNGTIDDYCNASGADGTYGAGNWLQHSYAEYNDTTFAVQNGRTEFDYSDWRIRYEQDLDDDLLVYGLVATGHKAGGFNDNLPTGTETEVVEGGYFAVAPTQFDATTQSPVYDGENVTYYEVGSKQELELAGYPVTFNASAFHYDYQDYVVTTVMPFSSILTSLGIDPTTIDAASRGKIVTFNFNAAEATISGLHLSSAFDLPYGLNVNLDGVFMATELTMGQEIVDSRYQFDPANPTMRNLDGNELPRSPDLQLKLELSQSLTTSIGTVDWITSFGYKSEAYSSIFNAESYGESHMYAGNGYTVAQNKQRLDGTFGDYWTIDVGFGFSPAGRDNLKLEGFVKNLTDEHESVYSLITGNDHLRWFNTPRTAGLRLRAFF